jgi:L-lactate utilization protein LutB
MGEDEEYFDYEAVIADEDLTHADYPGDADTDEWAEIAAFLEETRQHQVDRLRTKLGRIEEQIERRYEVFEQTRGELRDRIRQPAKTLERLYGMPSTGPEQEKEALKEELARLYSRLAEERTRCWQDLQQLEEQKRAVLEELDAVLDDSVERLC